MCFLRFLLFICTFCALTSHLDALICPKGQMVDRTKTTQCVRCKDGYFQPEENESKNCKPCGKCDGNRGSKITEPCTLTTNTKCQCRETFVPLGRDSITCTCPEGFETQSGECVKRKEKNPATENTSNKIPHLIPSLTSSRPREGARTQEPKTVTTATGHQGLTTTPTEKAQDSYTTRIVMGLILVMFALVLLTVLTCKRNILSHMQKKPERTRDSSYRTPVEESGDGSQDSLKQNPEEP